MGGGGEFGAQHGVLIKDAESLETAHKVKTIIFDKTGTLTKGKPEVTDVLIINEARYRKFFDGKHKTAKNLVSSLLSISASIEKLSEHPLGEAIVKKAEEEKLILSEIKGFKSITGKGVEGEFRINNSKFRMILGNRKMMKDYLMNDRTQDSNIKKLENEGKTIVFIATKNYELRTTNYELIGLIAIADTIKESAKEAILSLNKMGIETVMITGDNQATANAIGKKIRIKKNIA